MEFFLEELLLSDYVEHIGPVVEFLYNFRLSTWIDAQCNRE